MKENQLARPIDDDKTPVLTDRKSRMELREVARGLGGVLSELLARTNGVNVLEKGFSLTLASLIESHSVDILKAFEYESQLVKEHEERYEKIRGLNIQNRELRKQLGEKVSPEDVREFLKNSESKIRKWWQQNGMGFCTDFSYGGYGVQARFDCTSRISSRKNVEALHRAGIETVFYEGNDYEAVSNNPNNINRFRQYFQKRFPSCEIQDIAVRWSKEKDVYYISDVTVYIFDFADI